MVSVVAAMVVAGAEAEVEIRMVIHAAVTTVTPRDTSQKTAHSRVRRRRILLTMETISQAEEARMDRLTLPKMTLLTALLAPTLTTILGIPMSPISLTLPAPFPLTPILMTSLLVSTAMMMVRHPCSPSPILPMMNLHPSHLSPILMMNLILTVLTGVTFLGRLPMPVPMYVVL